MNSVNDVITRAELAQRAQDEGLDVTERTIRYWAGQNLLPRPIRLRGQGTRAFYPASLLDMVRALVALRPAKIRSLREQLYEAQIRPTKLLGAPETNGQRFEVLSTPISWSSQDFEYSLYTLADDSGSLLLLKKKRNLESEEEEGGNDGLEGVQRPARRAA